MGFYNISFKKSAEKELRSLDKKLIPRVLNSIEDLSDDPMPSGCRKLVGSEMTYRIRIGDYRVIYLLDHDASRIEIQKIAHRREIYR